MAYLFANISVAVELPQPDFLSPSVHELLWHIDCAVFWRKGDLGVETIAKTATVKSSSQSRVDWSILAFWLTYLSLVFGVIYAAL